MSQNGGQESIVVPRFDVSFPQVRIKKLKVGGDRRHDAIQHVQNPFRHRCFQLFHKHQQSYLPILPIVALGYRPFTGRHLHLKRFQHLRCPVQLRFFHFYISPRMQKKNGGKERKIVSYRSHLLYMYSPQHNRALKLLDNLFVLFQHFVGNVGIV